MALTNEQLRLLDSCPVLSAFKDWFIAVDNENEPEPIKRFFFKSYGDSQGETEWGKGTVKTTGVTNNGYSQVKVTTNSSDQSFVGQKFYIISTAKTDGTIYQLYSDAGTTAAGIYVEISETAFEEDEEENNDD